MFGFFNKYYTHLHITRLPATQILQDHTTDFQLDSTCLSEYIEPCVIELNYSLPDWPKQISSPKTKPRWWCYMKQQRSDCFHKHVCRLQCDVRPQCDTLLWQSSKKLLFWQHWQWAIRDMEKKPLTTCQFNCQDTDTEEDFQKSEDTGDTGTNIYVLLMLISLVCFYYRCYIVAFLYCYTWNTRSVITSLVLLHCVPSVLTTSYNHMWGSSGVISVIRIHTLRVTDDFTDECLWIFFLVQVWAHHKSPHQSPSIYALETLNYSRNQPKPENTHKKSISMVSINFLRQKQRVSIQICKYK